MSIGVVGGRLVRQPRTFAGGRGYCTDAEGRGYNFSLGLAQVNRYNLAKYGLSSYEKAFETCPNLQAGSRIPGGVSPTLRADWGKSFSLLLFGQFHHRLQARYVQKIFASMTRNASGNEASAIALAGQASVPANRRVMPVSPGFQQASVPVPAQVSRRSSIAVPGNAQYAGGNGATLVYTGVAAIAGGDTAIGHDSSTGHRIRCPHRCNPSPQPIQPHGPQPDQAFVF